MGKPNGLVQETLDLLILKTLSLGPKHGWAIARRIQQISREVLQVQQGSLYPALHRLEHKGWISAKWAETETGKEGKLFVDCGRASATWKRIRQLEPLVCGDQPGARNRVGGVMPCGVFNNGGCGCEHYSAATESRGS
jgi:PadR family transcriptional regulator PadR